ncbi:flagellar basal body L-ring protein FlgH [Limimaricola pyoseonensis]|uniref:Flagellar L-ring protein n=1 Tax=Limimaricola pyoseonensis TaxID=521013 RepID=A0A1G7KB33_9RHOB|nr:flagellar basal body L-ring protein FlgH [Limimaricola pyoseonensis]SDF34251.1 flagellar L-ring protein precursor FlgH [Limimaricola pyoseonensis]
MNHLPLRPAVLLLAGAALLSACGVRDRFDRDPQTTQIAVNPVTIPEAAAVSVPMPPPAPPRVYQRAEAASLWERGGSGGFFADQRASEVGDILTVDIRIDDRAQLRNAGQRSRDGQSSIDFPVLFGYGTQIDRILPGVGPEDLPSGEIVDIGSSIDVSGSGTITRGETIELKVAALVVQELPNGNLVIAGRQEVKVNQELRELRVAGIIRPEDIQMNNTIPYEKIAEARITYGGRGQLSRTQERGYGEDALDIILPY